MKNNERILKTYVFYFFQGELVRCPRVLSANGNATGNAENFKSIGSGGHGIEEPRI